MGLLRARSAQEKLEALVEDDAEVLLYLNRNLVRRTVGGLAKGALAAITGT
jgi:hypothetical protein